MKFMRYILLGACAISIEAAAQANSYPDRQITIIVRQLRIGKQNYKA